MTLPIQEALISTQYRDYIIPSTVLNEEIYQNRIPQGSHYLPIDSLYTLLLTPDSGQLSLTSFTNYSTIPKLFLLQDLTSLEVSGIIQAQTVSTLNLTGKGVLIGFIDTGIQFTNPVFSDLAGNTRIEAIWDQSIQTGTPPVLFPYGSEYLKSDIQTALSNKDPLSVLPSTDEIGHGTALASIAVGKALPEYDFTGAAPEASIAVVKLKEAKSSLKEYFLFSGNKPVFQESDIMMAYMYLVNLARSIDLPLVVCLGIGSNQGDHSGNTPLEHLFLNANSYISNTILSAAGNECNRNHHYFSSFTDDELYQDVEILVEPNTSGFITELWSQAPDLFSVGFVSPGGEVVERIPPTLNRTTQISFVLEKTQIEIHYETVQTISGSQLIFMRFLNPSEGIWKIRVYASSVLLGSYHLWLPIYGFVTPDVTFLDSNPYTTIVTPSNSIGVITCASYNAYDESLYLYSSRGNTRLDDTKPDITAPGVEVSAFTLYDSLTTITGTCAACAVAAGGAALIIEWGLKQNQAFLFTTTDIKNILIRGTQKNTPYRYPNREWGYGKLNIYQSFIAFINL